LGLECEEGEWVKRGLSRVLGWSGGERKVDRKGGV
jgi:hypothetical protein